MNTSRAKAKNFHNFDKIHGKNPSCKILKNGLTYFKNLPVFTRFTLSSCHKKPPLPLPLYRANNDETWKSYTLTKQAPSSAICIFQHN